MPRLAPLVVSLALAVSPASCDLITEPESPPKPEVIPLVLSGYLPFEPDTVRVSIGDTLVMAHYPSCSTAYLPLWRCGRWADPPEAGPGQVLLTYRSFNPVVIGCLGRSKPDRPARRRGECLVPVFGGD